MKIVFLMFRWIKEQYGRRQKLIFIKQDQKTRKNLLNILQMQERSILPAKNAAKKAMTLVWPHDHEYRKKYSVLRLPNGGGTRKHYFINNAKAADTVEAMKNIFFPDGNGKLGKLKAMLCFLGNYQEKLLDEDNFNLINYIHKNKFPKTRLLF